MYTFKESVKHESEAGEALNLISIQISKISNSCNFVTFTAMALKLQDVANWEMFFHVLETIHFIPGSKSSYYDATGNVWQGTTVENNAECFCVSFANTLSAVRSHDLSLGNIK